MCKSQTLFYPQWFQGQGAGRATATFSAANLPCCPPPSPEHIICQRHKQRKSRGCPAPGCREVWVRPCRVCPRSLHCPLKLHQVFHAYLQLVTCLHSLSLAQILLLTPPGKAISAGACKWHAGSWRHAAIALTMDDSIWLSSEHKQTPWPLLVKSPLLPAVWTPGIPAGSPSFSCLHPEASPPRTLPPPPAAVGPQQPGHQQILDSGNANFGLYLGEAPSPPSSRAVTPRSVPKNHTRHVLQPRFGLSTASTPQNRALGRL